MNITIKKLFTLLLAVALLFSLAACMGTPDKPLDPIAPPVEPIPVPVEEIRYNKLSDPAVYPYELVDGTLVTDEKCDSPLWDWVCDGVFVEQVTYTPPVVSESRVCTEDMLKLDVLYTWDKLSSRACNICSYGSTGSEIINEWLCRTPTKSK